MVKKDATLRFFTGLAQVGSDIAGADSPVAVAAKSAVNHPSPAAFVLAQEELAKLSDELRAKILSKLHTRMRNDIEAIWDNLPNSPESSRPN